MRRWLFVALALLVSAPAQALVLDAVDDSPTTSAPTPASDDPGWSRVGNVGGLTGTYLGNGWVITAGHVGSGYVEFDGVVYPAVPGSEVYLQNSDATLADLKVFRIDPSPTLPLLRIRASTPPNNTNMTMIGRGFWRGTPTIWMGHGGYYWGASGKRWGTNKVYGSLFAGSTWSFRTTFTQVGSAGSTTYEAQGASGDSGGPVFIKNASGNWELAGVLFAILGYAGQPDATSLYGNYTYAANLAVYRSQLISITRPQCANEVDDDGDGLVDWPADPGCTSELDQTEQPDQDLDGVGDPEDNCLTVPNPDQRDTNLDGFGNLCDGDFDQDDAVTAADYFLFKQAYLTKVGDPGYDPDMDLDGDGVVAASDYARFRAMYLGQPGPSGLACAGIPPCP